MTQKNITKSESVAEFLARGGNVTKCPTKEATKKYRKLEKKAPEAINYDMLPEALKIRYGIR